MLSKVAFALTTALGYLTVQNPGSFVDLAANDASAISALAAHSAQDHTAATWIWTNEGNVVATRAFRYLHTTPIGKFARFALCEVAADDGFVFYFNNATISSQNVPNNWPMAKRHFLNLSERVNLFAAAITNTDGPVAFIAACRIVYSDGSIDTIVTDTTWRTVASAVPPNFQSPMFVESSNWVNATSKGAYGVSPWGNSVVWFPFPSPAVNFTSESKWIWTSEWSDTGLPVSSRPFRYTFSVPTGKTAKYVTAMVAVEDEFELYVNGEWVGTGSDRTVGYRFVVPVSGSSILIALVAHNKVANSNAGVVGAFQVVYDDGSLDNFSTNATYKTVTSAPPLGFQLPGFNDAAWSAATVVVPSPGTITTPPL